MVNNNFSRGAVALSNQLRLAQNLSVYVEGVPCTMIKRHRRDWVKRMLIVRDVIVPNSQIESHWFRISADHCACNKILPLTKDPLRYRQNTAQSQFINLQLRENPLTCLQRYFLKTVKLNPIGLVFEQTTMHVTNSYL